MTPRKRRIRRSRDDHDEGSGSATGLEQLARRRCGVDGVRLAAVSAQLRIGLPALPVPAWKALSYTPTTTTGVRSR
jgi:hypothetical protein